MKYVVFIGAKHHLRYIQNITNYYKCKTKEISLFIINSTKEEIIDQCQKEKFYCCIRKEDFNFHQLIFEKNKVKNAFNDYKFFFNVKEDINLFSCVTYDYIVMFKSIFKNTKVHLLDDGFGFFSNINLFFTKKRNKLRIRYLILSVIYGKYINKIFDVNFFSELNHRLIHNDNIIQYTKNKEELPNKKISKNTLFILGIPDVEANFISEKNYINQLNKIINKFEKHQIIYYPHRVENEKKLNLLKCQGIEVIYSKIPIENYLMSLNTYPEKILGFMSSHAPYSLLVKYNNIPKMYIFDSLSWIWPKDHIVNIGIKDAYSNYDNFEIISLK